MLTSYRLSAALLILRIGTPFPLTLTALGQDPQARLTLQKRSAVSCYLRIMRATATNVRSAEGKRT